MKVLILNWRDPKNYEAGGAEKLNLKILEPLLERGDKVTWYSKAQTGLPSTEIYKGIKIIRYGNTFTHLLIWPLLILLRKFGKVDIVFDCIHGIGYLTPLLMPLTKRKVLIYEMAQNIWDENFSFPVNLIGKILEKAMLVFYSSSNFWTISESTKKDLEKMGVKNNSIKIIPMGFDGLKNSGANKYKNPTALFVGRLTEAKGIKDAITAISMSPKWELEVIGKGSELFETELKNLVNKLKIGERIKFMGFVSEKIKFEEMSKCWILIVPSSREGWGMIVPEANFSGTPALVYNSPGLVDSTRFYSKRNIIVNSSPDLISEQLMKIEAPIRVDEKIEEGWKSTQEFVKDNI